MDDELTIIILPFAPAKPDPPAVCTSCATSVVKKNVNTPMGPRSVKTPVAGKMVVPSEWGEYELIKDDLIRIGLREADNGKEEKRGG
jgi:hypothetical protein